MVIVFCQTLQLSANQGFNSQMTIFRNVTQKSLKSPAWLSEQLSSSSQLQLHYVDCSSWEGAQLWSLEVHTKLALSLAAIKNQYQTWSVCMSCTAGEGCWSIRLKAAVKVWMKNRCLHWRSWCWELEVIMCACVLGVCVCVCKGWDVYDGSAWF